MALEDLIYFYKPLGQNQIPFTAAKIRTMYPGSDKKRDEIVNSNGTNHLGKPKDDPRAIPSRRFLRKFWIDELPQIINVLLGQMKLVGIRPKTKEVWASYPLDHKKRALLQKPGLIGVNYASPTSTEQDYLNDYERSGLRTDIHYFLDIAYNIIVNGQRSE